jgi:hypothetical protein
VFGGPSVNIRAFGNRLLRVHGEDEQTPLHSPNSNIQISDSNEKADDERAAKTRARIEKYRDAPELTSDASTLLALLRTRLQKGLCR